MKHHVPAIEDRDRQQVQNRKADTQQREETQEGLGPGLCRIAGDLSNGNGAAQVTC